MHWFNHERTHGSIDDLTPVEVEQFYYSYQQRLTEAALPAKQSLRTRRSDSSRDALASPDPATALGVALIAFHSLTGQQARQLQLTDVVDGRLSRDERSIPWPIRCGCRLTAWLDHRVRRWPHTINPHLLLAQFTAGRLTAPSRVFLNGDHLRSQALREDRILAEAQANGVTYERCALCSASASKLPDTLIVGRGPAPARPRSRP